MVTIFDSNGEVVDINDDWRGTDSRVRFDVDAGETYYVMVEGYGESTGQYRMVARQITNQFRMTTDRFSAIDRLFAGFIDNNHRV